MSNDNYNPTPRKSKGYSRNQGKDFPPPSPDKENHQFKFFRGVWTPASVMQALLDGEICSSEYLLLQIVEALVDPTGDGCWASNSWLGERLDVGERRVRQMIDKLVDLGFLIQIIKNDWRYLETCWSRAGERVKIGKSGNPVSESRKCRFPIIDTPNGVSSLEEESHCRPSGHDKVISSENTNGNGTKHSNPSEMSKEPRPSINTYTTKHKSVGNGVLTPPPTKKGKEVAVELSRKLAEADKLTRRVYEKDIREWAYRFDEIVKTLIELRDFIRPAAIEYTEKVLLDHLRHVKERFQPKIYSIPKDFKDFVRLEDARQLRIDKLAEKETTSGVW